MIGTRHEKIVIVLAAYVIGFTTAFIAFGVNEVHEGDATAKRMVAVAQTPANETVDYKKVHHNISEIGTDEFGLYVNVGGYKRTISAAASLLGASVIQGAMGPGYAVEHLKPAISTDGWFAFYCEKATEDADACSPFVYSLFDDTIHKVTLNGVQEPVRISDFTVAWSSDNYLLINGYSSVDNVTPWKFEFTEEKTAVEETAVPADDQFQAAPPEVQ
jgi:hypothetical protein